MIKLLSLISSLGLGASSVAPIIEVSNNIKEEVVSKTTNLNIIDGDYQVYDNFPYYTTRLESWAVQPEFTTGQAATAMIKAGFTEAVPTDFELVSAYNISKDRALSDDDLLGREGAGTTLVESVLKATPSGEAKGYFGEMKIYSEHIHESLDLALLNGQIMPRVVNNTNDVERISLAVHSDIFTYILNSYELPTFQHVNSVETSKFLFKSGTNELFTQEDLDAMEVNEQITLDFWLTPTQEGRDRGVYNKATMTLNYRKPSM